VTEAEASDPHFLNSLQKGVAAWIANIHKVTKLERDPASGTALDEVNFWLGLATAIDRILEQLEAPEIRMMV